MKRFKSKKNKWEDHYTRKARKDKFPARSVYKLQEIQKKFRIIKKGDSVLDLGCSPGSWLQYAAELTGASGKVVGVDIKPVESAVAAHVEIITGDVFSDGHDLLKSLGKSYNVILSDMAPSTTGYKDVDAARSFELCGAALDLAREFLAPGGNFVCKIFQGPDFETFITEVKNAFSKRKIFKPDSSRKASKEIYVIGTGKK